MSKKYGLCDPQPLDNGEDLVRYLNCEDCGIGFSQTEEEQEDYDNIEECGKCSFCENNN